MVSEAAICNIAPVRMDMASILYGQASASLHGREGRLPCSPPSQSDSVGAETTGTQ